MRKVLLAFAILSCALVFAQDDSASLADVARQTRMQKQQKDSRSGSAATNSTAADRTGSVAGAGEASAKSAHVFTNENLGEGKASTAASDGAAASDEAQKQDPAPNAKDRDAQAQDLRSAIQSQKDAVTALKQQIASETDSIHYLGGNCVANCVQWNEQQKQKQDEVEAMKTRLAEEEKKLEDMQESARKQGFGSSVYEP